MKITIGQLKYLLDRQRNYMSWLNTAMLAYLFFQKIEFKWYYIAGLLLIVLCMMYIDTKFIIPKELSYIWGKNPKLKDLYKLIKEK